MRKISYILTLFLIFASTVPCFAQEKKIIDRIGSWRRDMSCGMEIGELIRTYKDKAVPRLEKCCKVHKSACLNFYSSPDNKTLLYTAIETKSYEVANFLFDLSDNYKLHVDDYGMTEDYYNETTYFIFIEAKEDQTSKTPLMLACSKGDLKGAKLLINNGASLLKINFTKSGKNKNAYQYATESKYKDPGFMDYIEKAYKAQKDMYGKIQQVPSKIYKNGTNKALENEMMRKKMVNEKLIVSSEEENPENLL